MLNSSESSVMTAQARAVKLISHAKDNHPRVATSRALTAMMRHGGV